MKNLPERTLAYTTRDIWLEGAGGLDRGTGKAVVHGGPNKAVPAKGLIEGLALLFLDCHHYGGEVEVSNGMDHIVTPERLEAARKLSESYGYNAAPTTIFFKQFRGDLIG